jgi:hypothetical protein
MAFLQKSNKQSTRYWWFMPIILVTQEDKIRGITVQEQPGKELQRLHLNQ